jgi:hypothetical protein
MTSTVVAGLARLVLGWGFAAAALWWVLSVQPASGPVATILNRQLTKADLPALPLLAAGGLLSILAVVGRQPRPAMISTVLLSLFAVTGWMAMWWLAIEPAGEGAVLAPITPSHGITQSDIVVFPTILMAATCGVGGLVGLVLSATAEEPRGSTDASVSLRRSSAPATDRSVEALEQGKQG